MAREINLVPDIKAEMIKTLKIRNLIFLVCIIVGVSSIVLSIIIGLIAGGQQIALDSKKATLESLSAKVNSYSSLGDFLTIKDQLGNLDSLSNNHNVLSRTFSVLSALLPRGEDKITISELSIDLSGEQPVFTLDAQADAGKEPFIDYNVLDSFKKSMQYMRYDYGRYVDKDGNTIPAYCMLETSPEGAIFQDSDRGIYAYWTIDAEGCYPSKNSDREDSEPTASSLTDYDLEDYNGQSVVRVWRTPQFSSWYKDNETEGQPYMGLDGTISGVEHFDSSCITYSGNKAINPSEPKWTETNDNCLLVPDGIEGIKILDSSNGRNNSNELVLRFSATITLSPEVYKFSNTHMLAIAPAGRRNVTDSYVQIQDMFSERAEDCKENDAACNSYPTANSNDKEQNSEGGD